jgi:glutaredoxin 3
MTDSIVWGVHRKNLMNFVVYTKSGCPNCVTAKQLLKSKHLDYQEYNVDNQNVMHAFITKYPDARGMPQIFINNQRIGGLAGLQAALKELGL